MRIGTFISGLFLVLIGTVLLLINFGYGSWEIAVQIGKWWPVLLVFLGLSLFNSGRIPRWIAFVLLVLLVLGVGACLRMAPPARTNSDEQTASNLVVGRQEYPQIKLANLDIDYGGGQLELSPGTTDIIKAQFSQGEIQKNIVASDQVLKIGLIQSDNHWPIGQITPNHWRMQISPNLFWNLNIKAGAIDGAIDLTGIPLRQLNCDLGAGNMDFILSNNGPNGRVQITAGASSIKLEIREDTGVTIKMGGALNTSNLDKLGWTKDGDLYQSPNYNEAANKIDCDIQLSAGNLEVQTGLDI